MTAPSPRLCGLAVLFAAAGVALAACSNTPSSPPVASLGNNGGSNASASPATSGPGGTGSTVSLKGNPTGLLDQWADCERSHGDPNQADPTIDAYGGINITIPQGVVPAGNPHDATGTCSQYLVAAQKALRAANPVQDPQGPSMAQLLQYVGCMRANGFPGYPSPSGPGDSQTSFQGTGVDPTSPAVEKVSESCGKKLDLPAWWIAGTGPPGDITVGTAGMPGSPPACFFAKNGCGAAKPAGGGSGDNG
jgi:hypothetical protein